MANSIVIGVVQEVTSLTAGTFKSAAGTLYSYSDATLITRSVELALGEWVIGIYDGVSLVEDVCSLTEIYEQGLEDANSANELTAAQVKQKLQVANCCAQKQSQKDVDQKLKGKPGCPDLLEDSVLMTNLVDAICGIVPEGESVSGNQAVYQLKVTNTGNGAFNMDISVVVGSVTYTLSIDNTPARTVTNVATAIADFINALYPDSYSYFAESSGANIIISGSEFDEDNATAVSVSITNGTIVANAVATLAGGTEAVLQGENNITNFEIQEILDKLNSLCKLPCDKIFQN